MADDKERKTATYTVDELKLSRDYRKTDECKQIIRRLDDVLVNMAVSSEAVTISRIAYVIGMLDDLTGD